MSEQEEVRKCLKEMMNRSCSNVFAGITFHNHDRLVDEFLRDYDVTPKKKFVVVNDNPQSPGCAIVQRLWKTSGRRLL